MELQPAQQVAGPADDPQTREEDPCAIAKRRKVSIETSASQQQPEMAPSSGNRILAAMCCPCGSCEGTMQPAEASTSRQQQAAVAEGNQLPSAPAPPAVQPPAMGSPRARMRLHDAAFDPMASSEASSDEEITSSSTSGLSWSHGVAADAGSHAADRLAHAAAEHAAELDGQPDPSVDRVLQNRDLLCTLFRSLDVLDLCRLSRTCRHWRDAAMSDSFWSELVLLTRPMTPDQVTQICRRHGGSIRRLTFGNVAVSQAYVEPLLHEALPSLSRLHKLHLHALTLPEPVLHHVRDNLPLLHKLVLTQCTLTRTNNGEACISHQSVRELDVLACRCSRLVLRLPNLGRLSLRHSQMGALSTAPMPELQSLDMGGVSKLPDGLVRGVVTTLVSLRSLCLERCSNVSNDTVTEVASSLTQLTRLDLQGCPNIGLQVLRNMPEVKVLLLNGCEGLSGVGNQHGLDTCPSLEELYMDGCCQLNALSMGLMPNLRILSLRSCRALATLDIRCRRLRELRVGALPVVRFSSEDAVVAAAIAMKEPDLPPGPLPPLPPPRPQPPLQPVQPPPPPAPLPQMVLPWHHPHQHHPGHHHHPAHPLLQPGGGGGGVLPPLHWLHHGDGGGHGGGHGHHHQHHLPPAGFGPDHPFPPHHGHGLAAHYHALHHHQQVQQQMMQNLHNAAAAAVAAAAGFGHGFAAAGLGAGPAAAAPQLPHVPHYHAPFHDVIEIMSSDDDDDMPPPPWADVEAALGGPVQQQQQEQEPVAAAEAAAAPAAPLPPLQLPQPQPWALPPVAPLPAGALPPVAAGYAGAPAGGGDAAAAQWQAFMAAPAPGQAGGGPVGGGLAAAAAAVLGGQGVALPVPQPQQPPAAAGAAPAPAAAANPPAATACPTSYGGSACGQLKRVSLGSDDVRSLTWSAFPHLDMLDLDCPNLESLVLHDCDKLTELLVSELGQGASGRTSSTPSLKELRIESCDGLSKLSLHHKRLRSFALARCRNVKEVNLQCPQLQALTLEECEELGKAVLMPVGVKTLTLGSCTTLHTLELGGPSVESLNLKGCALLQRLVLDCPALGSLDIQYCCQLPEDGLHDVFAHRPPLHSLVMAYCIQVGTASLAALSSLPRLRVLDLSFSDVTQLDALFDRCPALASLDVSSCRRLDPDCLMQVLPGRGDRLPQLRHLDVSYCPLRLQHVKALLTEGLALTRLALSGLDGVQDCVFADMTAAAGAAPMVKAEEGPASQALGIGGQQGQHQQGNTPGSSSGSGGRGSSSLSSLELVKCKGLQRLVLGLAPAPGCAVELYTSKQFIFLNKDAAAAAAAAVQWVDAGCALDRLTELKLGLSHVQVLALRLPHLRRLDLNGCGHLRILELRCPLLLTLYMQACRLVPSSFFWSVLSACPSLASLDVQHNPSICGQLLQAVQQYPTTSAVQGGTGSTSPAAGASSGAAGRGVGGNGSGGLGRPPWGAMAAAAAGTGPSLGGPAAGGQQALQHRQRAALACGDRTGGERAGADMGDRDEDAEGSAKAGHAELLRGLQTLLF